MAKMTENSDCDQCVESAGWIDLAATFAQAIFRSLLGLMSGSMGLAAQGLYSTGDAITKGLTLVSIRISKVPPSKTFPFGAGKILFVSSMAIGVSLVFVGIYLASTSFSEPNTVEKTSSIFAILGVLVSASFSEILSRYLLCIANKNNNIALKSASRDNHIDAITSIVVLLGVILSDAGVPAADHIAALIVSIMVINIGRIIAWDAIKGLLDVTVPRDVLDEIARKSRRTKGVQDIKLVRGRSLGEFWEIYLHVALDESITISEGDEILSILKSNIMENFSQVQHVWVITVPNKKHSDATPDYWSEHLFSIKKDITPTEVSASDVSQM